MRLKKISTLADVSYSKNSMIESEFDILKRIIYVKVSKHKRNKYSFAKDLKTPKFQKGKLQNAGTSYLIAHITYVQCSFSTARR